LVGIENVDSGHISFLLGDLYIDYPPQGLVLDPSKKIQDVLSSATGDLAVLEAELARLANALSCQPEDDKIENACIDVLQQVESID
jgi:hypothetical protein